jgi:hypothetical protein
VSLSKRSFSTNGNTIPEPDIWLTIARRSDRACRYFHATLTSEPCYNLNVIGATPERPSLSVRATSKRLSVLYRMVRGVIGAILGAFKSNVDGKGLQKNAAALHMAALKEMTSKNCTLQVLGHSQHAFLSSSAKSDHSNHTLHNLWQENIEWEVAPFGRCWPQHAKSGVHIVVMVNDLRVSVCSL